MPGDYFIMEKYFTLFQKAGIDIFGKKTFYVVVF